MREASLRQAESARTDLLNDLELHVPILVPEQRKH